MDELQGGIETENTSNMTSTDNICADSDIVGCLNSIVHPDFPLMAC